MKEGYLPLPCRCFNQEEDDEPIPDELLREGEREQQEQEKTAGIDEEREKNSIEGYLAAII